MGASSRQCRRYRDRDVTPHSVRQNPEGDVGLRCKELGCLGESQLSDTARTASGGANAWSASLIRALLWALHEASDNPSRAPGFAGESFAPRVRYACWRNGRCRVVYDHDCDRFWPGAIPSVLVRSGPPYRQPLSLPNSRQVPYSVQIFTPDSDPSNTQPQRNGHLRAQTHDPLAGG